MSFQVYGILSNNYVATFVFLCSALVFLQRSLSPKTALKDTPPIVAIPHSEIMLNPREAYGKALKKYGPVIGVFRRGRLEYITDKEYVRKVLAQDDIFSFEGGAFELLNINFISGSSLFKDTQRLVSEGLNPRLEEITPYIWSIITARAQEYVQTICTPDGRGIDQEFHQFCHSTISEVMSRLLFGNDSDIACVNAVRDVEMSLSELMGMFENTSVLARAFPRLWKIWVYTTFIIFHFIPSIACVLARKIWTLIDDIEAADSASKSDNEISLVAWLARQKMDPTTGRVSYSQRLWIITAISGFTFASIHNVAAICVWLVYELARQPDVLVQLRSELSQVVDINDERGQYFSYNSLQEARHLDSFIRELLRWKGDTLSSFRRATQDVRLDRYIIPKGSLITTLASAIHDNPAIYGESAQDMEAFRWVDQATSATSIGTTFIPFGLGRHACPGRYFAVIGMKLVVLSLISRCTPSLEGGNYIVKDRLNTVGEPLEGTLILDQLEESLM